MSRSDKIIGMIDKTTQIHSFAVIDKSATIWSFTQIREEAKIGKECIIGRGVYIDKGVKIGDRVKIQNNAQIYAPAQIANGAFIGPDAILTNDYYPRAVTPSGKLKRAHDWKSRGVKIGEGATIGAGAIVLAGVSIGKWAMIGAGAVVTKNIPDYHLAVGVPAKIVGKVKKCGHREGKCECESASR